MLREWRLSQFKSVGPDQHISLGPLTIFTGPNSSGKSTVLQSVLLVAQTLASRVGARPLVLNGEYAKLGAFSDVLLDHAQPPTIGIGFSLDLQPGSARMQESRTTSFPTYLFDAPQYDAAQISVDLSFTPIDSTGATGADSLQAQLSHAKFGVLLSSKDNQPGTPRTYDITRRSDADLGVLTETIGVSDSEPGAPLNRDAVRYAIASDAPIVPPDPWGQWTMFQRGRAIVSADLEHFLPIRLVQKYGIANRAISLSVLNLLTKGGPKHVVDAIHDWAKSDDLNQQALARAFQEVKQKTNGKDEQLAGQLLKNPNVDGTWLEIIARAVETTTSKQSRTTAAEFVPIPSDLAVLRQLVVQFFAGSLRYLGPLRSDPKPLYSVPTSGDPSNVGIKGEFTASVLHLYGPKMVDFVPPDDLDAPPRKCSLSMAVQAWLKHFDMADSYTAGDQGKFGHTLHIQPDGIRRSVDLTNVGVGVSQVLPILVTALVADPGAIILLEQPELHLHPKVQSRLADFFLAVIRTGRQCLVETHSEYLVNRLRLRIAESPIGDNLNKQVVLHFVERKPSVSYFRQVEINEYGAIPQWPKDFFDQGPNEADRIIAAALRKRQSLSRRSPSKG